MILPLDPSRLSFLLVGKEKAGIWWKIRRNAHWNCVPHMIDQILLILTAISPTNAGSVKQWKSPSHFLLSQHQHHNCLPWTCVLWLKKTGNVKQSSHPPFLSPSPESWSPLAQAKKPVPASKIWCLFLRVWWLQISGETVGEVKAVADMHQRKAEMARQSDAFIALPGECACHLRKGKWWIGSCDW